jgi:hypothetical protein
MQNANLIIIAILVGLFVTVPIVKAIMYPIKLRREKKRYEESKKYYARLYG